MISAFDSITEVNELLTACKQAIKDVLLGKRTSFNGREWSGEDLDKLQAMLNQLATERAKFDPSAQKSTAAITVIGRPRR